MPTQHFHTIYHDSNAADQVIKIDHSLTIKRDQNGANISHVRKFRNYEYHFENFFHPFTSELIGKINTEPLSATLDPDWQKDLKESFFDSLYNPIQNDEQKIQSNPKQIDFSRSGPYSVYNWELFFHIPLTIATHLSKNQRFAEAQRWFHYIFNPISGDDKVWNFLAFRDPDSAHTIEQVVRILSTPSSELPSTEQDEQSAILEGYEALLNRPFQPHLVARTRLIAYQYHVVMKYLDNLIAWGDHLFQQDTLETLNEATQIYVLAANILGDRPRQTLPLGKVAPKTFAQLKKEGLGPIGNALVDLEAQFPFNLMPAELGAPGEGSGADQTLFGIGRALYFCVPSNNKLLGYWDIVADRLFKIRHCMNIAGVVRPLALFDPPLDPGMMVKAAAAGIDIGSIVSGLNQPIGPVRSRVLLQQALQLCAEVRGLGNALLSALEKGDAERLALVRQRHEIQIHKMSQEVRFLQWKLAQENTQSLLTARKSSMERLKYYRRLIGIPADPEIPDEITIDHSASPDDPPGLTEENFDDVYATLIEQYDREAALEGFPPLRFALNPSPGYFSGFTSNGKVFLSVNEGEELNEQLPRARNHQVYASTLGALASGFVTVPDAAVNFHFWGMGGTANLSIGSALVALAQIGRDAATIKAGWSRDQAAMASLYASYERRADEWRFQYNLAAHELMQNGRQILTSMIAEEIAKHEYLTTRQQIANAREIDDLLHEKFTNEDLYLWMQGETSRLYYEYYRLAFDTARKAEKAMKLELMRPEVDGQDFIEFNYWDAGRKGLLSGDALFLDIKRMELAYHEHNKRELELTKHISLQQLNPLALLALRATGSCEVAIPEWLFDMDGPGHYMRRIKRIALTIPSVTGPYTNINCTLTLLQSSIRKSPVGDDYLRQGTNDERFIDYPGAAQSVVTSRGQNDSGLFEANLHDNRYLPFEGAGAISVWKLELPAEFRAFDYTTISDVVMHMDYTARQGIPRIRVTEALKEIFNKKDMSGLTAAFSLQRDFPTEWARFLDGEDEFVANIGRNHFPYFTQGREITIKELRLVDGMDISHHHVTNEDSLGAYTASLADNGAFTLQLDGRELDPPAKQVLQRSADTDAFVMVRYTVASP